VDAFIAGQAGDEAAVAAVTVARQVRDQDVDLTGAAPALRRGVARDRRISVGGDMRHGRKSRSVLSGGYKRHVMRDLDTGLVPAVGITTANVPEASVTGDITADLDVAGFTLSELHIDRAYLSSALVRDRGPDLAIFCKAWRVRNAGGRPAKDQFTLDFTAGRLSCPAGGGHAVRARPDRPLPGRHLRGLPAALPAATGAALPSTPMRRCWLSCATARLSRKDGRSCASASTKVPRTYGQCPDQVPSAGNRLV
jgi:hypothetical protein